MSTASVNIWLEVEGKQPVLLGYSYHVLVNPDDPVGAGRMVRACYEEAARMVEDNYTSIGFYEIARQLAPLQPEPEPEPATAKPTRRRRAGTQG